MITLTSSTAQPKYSISSLTSLPKQQPRAPFFKSTFMGHQPKVLTARMPARPQQPSFKIMAASRPKVSTMSVASPIEFFKSKPNFQNDGLQKMVKSYVDKRFADPRLTKREPMLNFPAFIKQFPELRDVDYQSKMGAAFRTQSNLAYAYALRNKFQELEEKSTK